LSVEKNWAKAPTGESLTRGTRARDRGDIGAAIAGTKNRARGGRGAITGTRGVYNI